MAIVTDLRQWTQSRPKKTMDLYYRHQEQLLVSTSLHSSILAQLKVACCSHSHLSDQQFGVVGRVVLQGQSTQQQQGNSAHGFAAAAAAAAC